MAPHPWASTPAQRDSDQPPRPITRSSGKAPEIPATPIATRVRRKGGQRRKPSPSDGQDTTVAPPKPSKPKPATLQEGEQCAHTSQPTMAVSDDRDMANLQPYEAGPPSDSISLHAVFPLPPTVIQNPAHLNQAPASTAVAGPSHRKMGTFGGQVMGKDIFADYAAWNNDDTEVPYQPLPLPPRASTSQTPSSRLYSSLPPWPIAHPTIPAKSINVLQGPAFSGSVLARHQASYPVHPAITPVPPPSPNAQSPCSPLSSHPTPSRTICTSSLRPRSTPVEDEEEEVHDLINHATCSDAEGTPLSAQAPGDRLERPHSDGSYAGQLDDQHTEPECDREQLDDEDAQPNDQLDELAAALQDDPTDDPFGDRIVPLIIESEPSASDDDYQEDSATRKSSKGCSF